MVDRLKGHPWKTASVGDETDSICPRCDDETIHRVVAMKEKKIHLVICSRCNSQHRYRPSLTTITRKVPLPSERQARVLKKVEADRTSRARVSLKKWQALKDVAGEMEPLPYDPTASYSEKQIVSHPTFGLGFVRKVVDKSKIEVVFEYEVKTLVMNLPK